MISGLTIDAGEIFGDLDTESKIVEFRNCKHLENIHNMRNYPEAQINYVDCIRVDGDTCDNYYTTEDDGKVHVITTDGSKSTISVVEKVTDAVGYPRVYAVDDTGAEDMLGVDYPDEAKQVSIPRRNANLSIYIPNKPVEDTDAVNKAYVDSSFSDKSTTIPGEGDNSMQQKGTEAKAFGDNSVALTSAIAGAKGYRYKAIDLANHVIYLTEGEITYNPDVLDVTGKPSANILFTDTGFTSEEIESLTEEIMLPYADKDIFTLKVRSIDFDAVGTITAIDKNKVTFAAGTAIDTLIQSEVVKNDTYIDRYSFSVPKKADLGNIVISEDAFAVGTDGTSAVGRYSFAAGRGNIVVGDTGTAFGRGNTAGYQAFVAGESSFANDRNYTMAYGSTNEGNFTFITGQNNTSDKEGKKGIAAGSGNKLKHTSCAAFGENNYTSAPYQTLIGRAAVTTDYDPEAYNIIFGVGNAFTRVKNEDGTITDTNLSGRRNAFSVWVDGHITAGRETVASDKSLTLTTKGYVNTTLNTEVAKLNDRISYVAASVSTHEQYVVGLNLPALTYGKYSEEDADGNNIDKIQTSAIQQGGSTAKGYGSVALLGGTAAGNTSFAAGEKAQANGQWSIALGHSAKANSHHCVAIGLGTATADPVTGKPNREQVVVGRYNKILDGASFSNAPDGARFIVGIGTGENTYNEDGTLKKENRKNGLVVWGDGRVTIGKAPENDMDVVNKKYLDTSISDLLNTTPGILNTLEELTAAFETHEGAYNTLLEVVDNKANKSYVDEKISSIEMPDTYSRTEIDNMFESLNTALQKIIDAQNSLIGGTE